MKKLMGFTCLAILLILTSTVHAEDALNEIHLFQSFLRDAFSTDQIFGDAFVTYDDYDPGSSFGAGFRGFYPINERLDMGAQLGFRSVDSGAEGADSESGLTDLAVVGKYDLMSDEKNVSVGGLITLPIGSEDVGQGELNFGGFGAFRYPLENMVVTGTVGLDFFEIETFDYLTGDKDTEYETSINIGAGLLYPIGETLTFIPEIVMQTEGDYMMLSIGLDSKLVSGSRLRGSLGVGLDDGAPDLSLTGTFLLPL